MQSNKNENINNLKDEEFSELMIENNSKYEKKILLGTDDLNLLQEKIT